VLPTLYVSTPPCALAVASNEAAVANKVENFMTTDSSYRNKEEILGEEVTRRVQNQGQGKVYLDIYTFHPRNSAWPLRILTRFQKPNLHLIVMSRPAHCGAHSNHVSPKILGVAVGLCNRARTGKDR
jgi:hypothetical protein